jgi:beta-lactamase class D
MKKTVVILFLSLVAIVCHAIKPVEMKELKRFFDKYDAMGSILIYDQNNNSYFGYNIERCNMRFCPASTFKIPNTLIALETGVVTINTVIKWDGKKQPFSSWEKDMTISEAFKLSCVTFYKEVARRVGVERMKYYLKLFNYGYDMHIDSKNIDSFWLDEAQDLTITQFQQIYFLYKLYNFQLPISKESMRLTKDIMLYEQRAGYKISAKTGWTQIKGKPITWFVGYVETNNNVYYFATNVEPKDNDNVNWNDYSFAQARINITKDVFLELKIIKK